MKLQTNTSRARREDGTEYKAYTVEYEGLADELPDLGEFFEEPKPGAVVRVSLTVEVDE